MKSRPKKRFGQHFLRDPMVLQQIASAIAPQPEDHMIEIGPGEGVLTQYLINKTKTLDLVEIDRDLIKRLQSQYGQINDLTIHAIDALQFNFQNLNHQSSARVVGNLPYNISTPLLFHCFQSIDTIKDMHFLLQKEVVDRITAQVGDKQYGRLSVMTQYFCETESLFDVEPNAFYPPPKVRSAVVRLTPHQQNELSNEEYTRFEAIVRDAFTFRRKTITNGLKKWINAQELESLNISPKARPQELSVNDFIAICKLKN